MRTVAAEAILAYEGAAPPISGTSDNASEEHRVSRDIEFFVAIERQVWEALKLGDAAADARLLADDFLGVYESGVSGKGEHVAQLSGGPIVAHYAMSSPRLIRLGPSAVLLSYTATWRATADAPDAQRVEYISSIWERRGMNWVNTFSQDTTARTV